MSRWLGAIALIAGLGGLTGSFNATGWESWGLSMLYLALFLTLVISFWTGWRFTESLQPAYQWYVISATVWVLALLTTMLSIGIYLAPATLLLIAATIRLPWEHPQQD